MTRQLFGAKPLPEPMFTYGQLDPQQQIPINIEWKYKITFIQQNITE